MAKVTLTERLARAGISQAKQCAGCSTWVRPGQVHSGGGYVGTSNPLLPRGGGRRRATAPAQETREELLERLARGERGFNPQQFRGGNRVVGGIARVYSTRHVDVPLPWDLLRLARRPCELILPRILETLEYARTWPGWANDPPGLSRDRGRVISGKLVLGADGRWREFPEPARKVGGRRWRRDRFGDLSVLEDGLGLQYGRRGDRRVLVSYTDWKADPDPSPLAPKYAFIPDKRGAIDIIDIPAALPSFIRDGSWGTYLEKVNVADGRAPRERLAAYFGEEVEVPR